MSICQFIITAIALPPRTEVLLWGVSHAYSIDIATNPSITAELVFLGEVWNGLASPANVLSGLWVLFLPTRLFSYNRLVTSIAGMEMLAFSERRLLSISVVRPLSVLSCASVPSLEWEEILYLACRPETRCCYLGPCIFRRWNIFERSRLFFHIPIK